MKVNKRLENGKSNSLSSLSRKFSRQSVERLLLGCDYINTLYINNLFINTLSLSLSDLFFSQKASERRVKIDCIQLS